MAAQLGPPDDLLSPPDDLISPPSDHQADASPSPPSLHKMPGIGGALEHGLTEGILDVGETVGLHQGADEQLPEAQPYSMQDVKHPISSFLPKTAYRLAKSSPVIAGGVAGAIGGGAAAGPLGALAGGAGGAGIAGFLQSYGPTFRRELAATPKDPDGAFDRAWKASGIDAAASAGSWAAFGGINPFKTQIKNLAFQALGIQPGISTAATASRNVVQGRPAGEGLGTAYVEGAVGTLVPVAGHRIIKGVADLVPRPSRPGGGQPPPDLQPGPEPTGPGPGPNGPIPRNESYSAGPPPGPKPPPAGGSAWSRKRPGETDRAWKARTSGEDVVDVAPDGTVVEPTPPPAAAPKSEPKRIGPPTVTKESVSADLLRAQETGAMPESAANMFRVMLDQGRMTPAQVADVLVGKPKAEEPTFKTNPGKIAAEHEAEVSTLEAEGTLAARPSSMTETAVRETPTTAKVEPQGMALPQKPWAELETGDLKGIRDLMTFANNKRTQTFNAIPKKGDQTAGKAAHKATVDAFWALSDQVKERYNIDWNDVRKSSPEELKQIIKDRNDPVSQQAFADVADYGARTPVEKSPTLFDEMRELGGIKDDRGDVKQILGGYRNPKFKKAILNPEGLSPDAMRSALQERGWFGTEERFGPAALETGKYAGDSLTDLYDLMEREAHGDPVYHPDKAAESDGWLAFEDELNRAGVKDSDTFEERARKLAEFRREHAPTEPPPDLQGMEEPPGWEDDNPFALQQSIFGGKPPVQSEKVGLGADLKRMIDIFGPKMYGQNMPEVTIKELLQNSFDAIKMAEARGDIAKGDGTITIELDAKANTISIFDNGAGMSPETVKDAFLTVAGTNKGDLKPSERSGGFGIAKLAFIFGNNGLKLTTVHDGVETTLVTNSKELLDGNAQLKTRKVDDEYGRNGTHVEVTIPKSFKDSNGEEHPISFPYKDHVNILRKPLIGDVDVKLSYKPEWGGTEEKTLDIGKNQKGLPPKVSVAHFPWGDVDVHFAPSTEKTSWGKPITNHDVLSSGLHQFEFPVTKAPMEWEQIPYNIVLDVKPKVAAEDPFYPFNNQRENFSTKIKGDIGQLLAMFRRQYRAESAQGLGDSFVRSEAMPIMRDNGADISDFAKLNMESHMPKASGSYHLPAEISIKNGKTLEGNVFKDAEEQLKEVEGVQRDKFMLDPNVVQSARPLFHSNLNRDLFQVAQEKFGVPAKQSRKFVALVGTVVLDFKNALSDVPGYEIWKEKGHPVGVSLDKDYHGVHIFVPFEGFFINPLSTKHYSDGAVARDWTHTMIHEAVHTKAKGHDEDFTSALADLEGAFEEQNPGLRMRLEKRITDIIAGNRDAFNALRDVFSDPDTANLEKDTGGVKGRSQQTGKSAGLPVGPRGIRPSERGQVQGPDAGVSGGNDGGAPPGGEGRNLPGPDELGPQYSKIVPKAGGEGRKPPGGGDEPPAERPDKGYWNEGGPTVSEWLTQMEDELYRLMNNNKMDRIDALQALWKLPEGHILRDTKTEAKMFHHGEEEGKFAHEQKDHILTPEEAAEWNRVIQPLREMANDEWKNIKPRLSPEQQRMLRGSDSLEGYMHRIVKGKGSEYDPVEGPSEEADPITGRGGSGRGLGKKSASMHARSPKWVAVGLDGSKKFIDGTTFTDARGPKKPQDAKDGAAYMDKDAPGGVRILRPANVEEIESNTNLRYHKNALINTMDNLLKLRRVSRNLDMLNILKADPVFTENSVLKTDSPTPPAGWRDTDIPQLNMYWMNSRMANMFDDYYHVGRFKGDLANIISNVNSALVRMIFANPVTAFMGHGANVAAHTVVQRGSMNFDPKTWPKSVKNFGKAANEVINMGPLYKALMREGMAGQYAAQYARDFHPTAVKIMQGEIEKDPKTWTDIAKIAGTTPKIMYDWLSDVSSKGLWMGSDILLMSHILDRMEMKNEGVHTAIRESEKGIPNYRIPTEAWEGPGGRAFSELMHNPLITIFGRYRYGMLKAYAHTVKAALAKEGERIEPPPPVRVEHQPRLDLPWGENEAPSPPPPLPKGEGEAHTQDTKWQRRAKAAAELLALFALMNVVYPELDKAVQKLMNNKRASIRRAGATTLPHAMEAYAEEAYKHPKTSNDFKDLHSIQSALFSFPPLMAAAVAIYNNASPVTGKHIYNPKGDMEEVLQEMAGFMATSPFLGQEAAEWTTGHKSWSQVLGGFLGINSPTAAQFALQRHYAKKDAEGDTKAFVRKRAQRRRNIEKKLKGLDSWIGKTINPSGGGT